MPQLITEVPLPDFPCRIGYQTPVLGMGSCFAEHILGKMEAMNFPVLANTQGILFNPASIARALERTVSGRPFTAQDLFQHQGIWHSYEHHGRFSHPDRDTCLRQINDALHTAHMWLRQTDVLILTLGTAYVWEDRAAGAVVANCHQVPSDHFLRRRLSVEAAGQVLLPVLRQLHEQRPHLHCIITVSPVRHLREGLIANQQSKAVLLLAAEALCRQLDFVHYFPAYEIQLDELRDYRFFAPNLTSPSETAIEYIWERFAGALLDAGSREIMLRIARIRRMLDHRPKYPGSSSHLEFLHNLYRQTEALAREFTYISFEKDLTKISSQLKKHTNT